jgi:lipopolysaccharide/colanic/teichoic acid biosynthesis glycosyltransferase
LTAPQTATQTPSTDESPAAVGPDVASSNDVTVETSKFALPTEDATVEMPMPKRVARAVGGGWGLMQGHRDGRTLLPKRSLRQIGEAIVALMILCGLSPLLLAVALAVKKTSKGPVFFRQERLGLHRAPFQIIKFRTMSNKNDDSIHRAYIKKMLTSGEDVDGGEQGVYKLVNDPRITRIGGFLRKTSIDELPQLWNVVRGEMSLVGPRPVLAWEADMFPPEAERRFAARPGLTGLWQVSGRSTLDFKAALELDVSYVERKSLWFDITILWRTVAVVLNRSTAR